MTALLIIAAILILILVLLTLPISIIADFMEEGEITVKYLFLRFKFGLKRGKEDKPKKRKKKSDEKPEIAERHKKEESLTSKVTAYSGLVRELLKKLVELLKNMVVKDFIVDIKVASSDAADTAIKYGSLCAVVYPTVALVDDFMEVRRERIDVYPDFDAKESEAKAYIKLSIKPFHVISAVIAAIKCIVKFKK